MIEIKSGDMFEGSADALVNTVNCVGVMGRGVALQFKERFPDNFKAYKRACDRGEVMPGHMFVFDRGEEMYPRWIINFPTKRHWRVASRMEDVSAGLDDLARQITRLGIRKIVLPPLGCGLGGLVWTDVRSLIESKLSELKDVSISVYQPGNRPDRLVHNRAVQKMKIGSASLVLLIKRYLDGLLDPFVSLIEIQKLMYFLQEAGEPLKLNFIKYHYGPYATNLRFVLQRMDGQFVCGYRDGGDYPDKEISLMPGADIEARLFMDGHPDTREKMDRVFRLVEGFETPDGMELLASVHWACVHEHIQEEGKVVDYIHNWTSRKRRFTARQIGLARAALIKNQWL